MRSAKPLEERFWSKVDKRGSDECWEWTGAKFGNGYGEFKFNGSPKPVHRLAYEFHTGTNIPKSMDVCHKCDNRACVNPAHLFLGTRKDNMQDCVRKGRQSKGETRWSAKLTESLVLQIRSDPRLQRVIAVELGVSRSLIGRVKRRDIWRHI